MSPVPTPQQVAAQVSLILSKRPEARVIGIHLPSSWAGGADIQAAGRTCPVAFCASPLEISERLVRAETQGEAFPLVILTPLRDADISLDVTARLAGRRLLHIDRWEVVRNLFGAQHIDPRLRQHGWIADALLQAVPDSGYPVVSSGWLDADTVWQHLFARHLGLETGRPDATDLVRWSLDAGRVKRYGSLALEFQKGFRERVVESAGAVGSALADAIESGHGSLLVPIGLVCEVLFAQGGRGGSDLAQAVARLEPFLGGNTLRSELGRAWSDASCHVLDRLPEGERRAWLDRAEQLLEELKAARYAGLSRVLLSGFEQRLAAFAKGLEDLLDGKGSMSDLEPLFDEALQHRQSETQTERVERLEMALRLARYLGAASAGPPRTLGQGMTGQAQQGAFVDWARRHMLGGDPIESVARAFGKLYRRIREARETENRAFASALAAWSKAPKAEKGCLPIEQVLGALVAPLAQQAPVMVVVVDGMDFGVFREICEDVRRQGWLECSTSPGEPLPAVVSMVPTVTEISRASLLAGRIATGGSDAEKAAFASHRGLVATSKASRLPILFHKGDLAEEGVSGLAQRVRDALGNQDQRIVGVVLNAVDDHLAKSEQLRIRWSTRQIPLLDAILFEARLAGRAVVLTSDHGHVLEESALRLQGDAEERWRRYGEPLSEQEIAIEGPRVKAATGEDRVVVLWSEAVRYCVKKNGYHGGATLQEVVVPLGVLCFAGQEPEGWEPLPELKPAWWTSGIATAGAPSPVPERRKPEAGKAQASLFEPAPPPRAAGDGHPWIQRLTACNVYQAQRRMAGRLAPPDETVQTILAALAGRNDRMPRVLLAQATGQPEFRLRGILAGLQRLLNVDGYQVLAVDEAAQTVVLDRPLLLKQFQIPG